VTGAACVHIDVASTLLPGTPYGVALRYPPVTARYMSALPPPQASVYPFTRGELEKMIFKSFSVLHLAKSLNLSPGAVALS
jgi:hypothetical protein